MKTTQKDIRNYNAIDITRYSFDAINKLIASEEYLIDVAYSVGTYGLNGLVKQGHKTGTLYKVTSRSGALFQIF